MHPGSLLAAVLVAAAPVAAQDDSPFTDHLPDADAYELEIDARLGEAREAMEEMYAVRATRTVENTLVPYDRARGIIVDALLETALLAAVHPDPDYREAALRANDQASAARAWLSFQAEAYERLAAIDTAEADIDAETRHYLERTLREFRLAGVGVPTSTMAKLVAMRDRLADLEWQFARNIAEGDGAVPARFDELEGLSPELIASQPRDLSGAIELGADAGNALRVLSDARARDLRRRMYVAFVNRAAPENIAVLDSLLAVRNSFARLIDFPSWADCIAADQVIGSADRAQSFLGLVRGITGAAMVRERDALLARLRRDDPGATTVGAWDRWFLEARQHAADAATLDSARAYFPYPAVEKGVLDLAATLFGVQIRPGRAPVWDPSVTVYEIVRENRPVARFYIDAGAREGKQPGTAAFMVRTGVRDERIPEGVLVASFSPDGALTPGQVRDFAHELAHLLHGLFAVRRWAGTGGLTVERDFIEAPALFFEAWLWQPAVLATFARHPVTGEPIPPALVQRVLEIHDRDRAIRARQIEAEARIGLTLSDSVPHPLAADSTALAILKQDLPFTQPEADLRPATSMAFLGSSQLSAGRQAELMAAIIARDLLSRFDRDRPIDAATGMALRTSILEQGSSAPAADLVSVFLGRPLDIDAWARWMDAIAP